MEQKLNYRRYTRKNLKPGFFDFFYNLSITNWIIFINVVFFIFALILFSYNSELIDYVALKPANILGLKNIWTLLTSMFMHGNFSHLFVNMISLMFIGNFVEKVIGRKRFFWFYMISGLVAGLFFVSLAFIFKTELDIYAVGASGAIFGLGGLLMILTPKLPVLVFFIIPMPMWAAMLFLLFGLWIISSIAGLPIGNTAHLGGLVVGVIFGLYLRNKYKRKVSMLNRMF
ncbi:MAG: rhomboid family intramembrane serine protease [Nanoarchaeota archaeon]|nr:rhomboid family intramembrane serine protease [Nanoarchaeota archaeon]